jgi:hypothetical protein
MGLGIGITLIVLGPVMNYQRTRSTHVEERRNTY